MNTQKLAARMWSRVVNQGDCWVIPGRDHYPRFYYSFSGWVYGHRLAWEATHGMPPPAGMEVCHHCDNKRCVRPDHLFLGSHADNMADWARKGLHWSRSKPESVRRGSAHPAAKLTFDQVQEIRTLASQGVAQIVLARRFGMGASQISRIVRGSAWMVAS